jgi:glycosyltransferase involved in cell wall biosynthesis
MRAVSALGDRDFEVVLCGEERLGGDPTRDAFVSTLGDRLVWDGYAEEFNYIELLNTSDVVVSTADHEFFGISVVEAVAAGCFPILPDRLSYPELIPVEFHDLVLYNGADPTFPLELCVSDIETTRDVGRTLAPKMRIHSWDVVAPAYDERLGVGRAD